MSKKRPYQVKKVLWKMCKDRNMMVPREFCRECSKQEVCDSPDVIKKVKKFR